MIDADLVDAEIERLEAEGDTTYFLCQRLAWLYTVRDHVRAKGKADGAVVASGGSEFLDACAGKPVDAVLRVLDEHMEAQRALYPKAYEGVMRRLREIR